jgi:hypothetical protein
MQTTIYDILDNLNNINDSLVSIDQKLIVFNTKKNCNQEVLKNITNYKQVISKNVQDQLDTINNNLVKSFKTLQTDSTNLIELTQYTTDSNMNMWKSTQPGMGLATLTNNMASIVFNNILPYQTTQVDINNLRPFLISIINDMVLINQYINTINLFSSNIFINDTIVVDNTIDQLVKLLISDLNNIQFYNNNIKQLINNLQTLINDSNQILNNEYDALTKIYNLNRYLLNIQNEYLKKQEVTNDISVQQQITDATTKLLTTIDQLFAKYFSCITDGGTQCNIPVKFTNKQNNFTTYELNTFDNNSYEYLSNPISYHKPSKQILEGFNIIKSIENMFGNKDNFENIKVGANTFKVHEDLDNPLGAAQLMAKLNKTAKRLIYNINDKFINDPNGLLLIKPEFRDRVHTGILALTKNYTTASLEENIPERSGGDTSYVVNKGDTFAMCLRDPKQNNKLQDSYNELVFVLVHEMSHLFTSTYGHDFMFWCNFNFLLNEAVNAKMYNVVNYKSIQTPYCGITVTYSPLFDTGLDQYYL